MKDNLVFVHGYLGGSPQWAPQVAHFSDYFNVLTPDLPGYGQNTRMEAPETIQAFAQYVLDELQRQNVDAFHVVGHSMGGMVVQEMVRLAPERILKLVLYGTGALGSLPGRFETLGESRQRVTEEGVATTGARIAATWFLDGSNAEGYPLCAELAVRPGIQAACAGLTAMESWSGESALSAIHAETMILWGNADRAYPWSQVERLWKQINNAQLAVIPRCSHAVHLEKSDIFNAILQDFLRLGDNS